MFKNGRIVVGNKIIPIKRESSLNVQLTIIRLRNGQIK